MAVCLAVSAVAVMLGFWQHGRHVERADARAAFDAAVQEAPASVAQVVPAGADELPDGAEWRTVTAMGTFAPDSLVVLRSRPVDGTPAWQYLAWLDTDDGRSLQVSLGWIPRPGPNEDPAVPTLDSATPVTVTGVLRAWEPDDGKEPTARSVTRIAPEQLPEPAHEPVPGYVMLRELCEAGTCSPAAVGEPVPLPALTLGPHLAYAWQWWLFAAMAPVGGVLLLRRDARLHAEGDGGAEPARASAAVKSKQTKPRRRRLSDEEIEDAL